MCGTGLRYCSATACSTACAVLPSSGTVLRIAVLSGGMVVPGEWSYDDGRTSALGGGVRAPIALCLASY
eukprot:1419272-Rhodomonas_salina.1